MVLEHHVVDPFSSLLADHHRLEMVRRAINEDTRFRESDIEFRMPRPSYTIDTLAYLTEKHPGNEFILIMGSDGLGTFNKWKNAEEIVRNYRRYVYPRPGSPVNQKEHPNMEVVTAPLIELSASMIRKGIREGKDMHHFLPPAVWEYIDEMNFFR